MSTRKLSRWCKGQPERGIAVAPQHSSIHPSPLRATRFGLAVAGFIGVSLVVMAIVLFLEKRPGTSSTGASSVGKSDSDLFSLIQPELSPANLSAIVKPSPTPSLTKQPQTVADLLAMKPEELAQVDLARANLICALGLPGSEDLDLEKYLQTLDQWAEKVRQDTDRTFYMFTRNPAEYENSEAYFRMLSLITVLQLQCGVRYNPERIRDVDFRRSQDLFIHGMITSNNGGTCVSMPVLYVAVARRLGWPVHLVLAKEHVFCRWDGVFEGRYERVNIEGAGRGLNSYPDDYYRQWPHPITEAEVQRGEFLKTLNPQEELATCLASRAYCLEANNRLNPAEETYRAAAKLHPQHTSYAFFANQIRKTKERTYAAWIKEQERRVMKPPPSIDDPALYPGNNVRMLKRGVPDFPSAPGYVPPEVDRHGRLILKNNPSDPFTP